MKSDFLFVGLNMNIYVQEKRQKHARFVDDAFKNKEH